MRSLPTIVLMSKDRPEALVRCARRYCEEGLDVVVADGSDHPLPEHARSGAWRYTHHPRMPYWQRLATTLASVSSTTCAIAADDDALLTPALAEAASLIEHTPAIVRAAGAVVHACQERPSVDRCFPELLTERLLDVEETRSLARFERMLRLGPQVFYCVIRTRVARDVANLVAALPDDALVLGEQLWTTLPALAGDYALIPRLQLVRSIGRPRYEVFLKAMQGVTSLRTAPSFRGVVSGIETYAREQGLDAAGASEALRLFDELGWKVTAPSLAARALGWARYAPRPSLWSDRRERVIFNGVRARSLARLGSYPWRCEVARREFMSVLGVIG